MQLLMLIFFSLQNLTVDATYISTGTGIHDKIQYQMIVNSVFSVPNEKGLIILVFTLLLPGPLEWMFTFPCSYALLVLLFQFSAYL